MNFFESQERSRRKTRYLLFLMTLAVIAVVGSVTGVLAVAGWLNNTATASQPFLHWVQNNLIAVVSIACGVTALIGCASLYRIFTLRDGGGRVAREMGGTLVSNDEQDPLKKRLRNVVEEMAIASGVPVPEIYVLEKEAGINAFAAGFSPEDAAVAVTRGTLETLERDELQGVIAHEFSHILNGDMRLNIKLMGPLYGILAISMIGRTLLRGTRRVRSSGRNGGAAFVLAIGLGLFVAGAIGLFIGRLIRAGVSRQREYLADASAVQFTRQTEGIAGALKKIGGLQEGSAVDDADAEEVSHMLFAAGLKASFMNLFASHPPLLDRIKAIEPRFTSEQYASLHTERINLAMDDMAKMENLTAGFTASAEAAMSADPVELLASIGQPDDAHLASAKKLLAALPTNLRDTLDSTDRVMLLLPAMLLHPDTTKRSPQIQQLSQRFGADRTHIIEALYTEVAGLDITMRLPLLELAMPRVKSQPPARIEFLGELLEQLALSDNQLEVFEYAQLRIFQNYIKGVRQPGLARWKTLSDRKMRRAAGLLLNVYVRKVIASEPELAFQAGCEALNTRGARYQPDIGDWVTNADKALGLLENCVPRDRERVVAALLAAALHNGRVERRESELLRAFCMMLGCPLPPILQAA